MLYINKLQNVRNSKSLLLCLIFAWCIFGFVFSVFMDRATYAQELTTELVASGLSSPVLVTAPAGDFERIFIVEQTGKIKVFKNGNLLPDPFLDISSKISSGGERGLLGLAFHPDDPGLFFVDYTNTSGNTVIASYKIIDGNPDMADPGSDVILLTISQPYSNHNGGCINFGSDGYLYIGMGDGGSGNDPGNRAQDGSTLLGKILRINVDGGLAYSIPADNPFVDDPGVLDEIWTIGVRNPWRYSFDRFTGDLYIADVGQNAIEELDFQSVASPGGENYGWRCMEGTQCTGLTGCTCDAPELTLPYYDYNHSAGRCSITGGYVYRSESLPLLQGTYFFGDYCSAEIWSLVYEGGLVKEFTDRTDELNPGSGLSIDWISSFGQDGNGDLYICDIGGEVFKIVSKMQLDSNVFKAGQNVVLQVTGAKPNVKVYFAYSLSGTGKTTVPPLGVDLALNSPQLAGTTNSNNTGTATIIKFVPLIAKGRQVWLQAAESGNTSNVISAVVQ